MAVTRGDRETVLCLRALGLGDLLTAVPALRALADALPNRRIVVATSARLAPLASLSGAVDAVVPADGLSDLDGCPPPALAVNLHGRGPESHRILLATEPRSLVAFRHDRIPETAGQPDWDPDEHEIVRWCRLLAENGIPADPSRLELARPPRRSPCPGAVVVHPGAASAARRWPAKRWAAVAAALHEAGYHVVLTGAGRERPLAELIGAEAGLPASAVLAGESDALALASIVAEARCVLCADTGVAHLATAFGTPSVVLFGPTPPSRWGPPSDRPQHVALWAGLEGNPHGEETFPGLLEIDVADVLAVAFALLAAGQDRQRTNGQPVRPVSSCGAPTGFDSGEPRWRR